ncbi:putative chromatin remodeler Bromodomain family [Helianthus annuus]|nr:putative chromatin remodeler Bromodomain family [Helianthus annuus]
MASAVLTSRNDHRSSDYITNFTRLQNFPNRNPNPKCNNFFVGNTSSNVICKPNQQQTAFIRSSINPPANSVPASSYGNGYRYITFRISSYTKTELQNLKKRLVSDLQRVRILQQWICLTTTEKLLKYHPPELNIPAVTAPNRSVGRKRSNPAPPVMKMKMKKQCGGSGGRMTSAQRRKMMMKKCEQILGKLMMHKHGWVFNTPVDAVALKLYDYHSIISNPMDLGTIKCKLARNVYESALAFAYDVRLTFQNAMVYNGKGSAVYIMAERLLLMFEGLFESMHQKHFVNQVNRVKKQNQSAGVPVSIEKVSQGAVVRVSKRPEMTDEEKADLAESFCNLQLGPEGMNQIMSIMNKGVRGLEHQGDEIELDLAVLDNDTLWALHGFIARVRAGLVANLLSSVQADQPSGEEDVDIGEDYVDIGEEMQLTVFPSVEIEKDDVNVNVSSSESSSDSDSSSSDSGSGNSSNEQEVNSTPKVGP